MKFVLASLFILFMVFSASAQNETIHSENKPSSAFEKEYIFGNPKVGIIDYTIINGHLLLLLKYRISDYVLMLTDLKGDKVKQMMPLQGKKISFLNDCLGNVYLKSRNVITQVFIEESGIELRNEFTYFAFDRAFSDCIYSDDDFLYFFLENKISASFELHRYSVDEKKYSIIFSKKKRNYFPTQEKVVSHKRSADVFHKVEEDLYMPKTFILGEHLVLTNRFVDSLFIWNANNQKGIEVQNSFINSLGLWSRPSLQKQKLLYKIQKNGKLTLYKMAVNDNISVAKEITFEGFSFPKNLQNFNGYLYFIYYDKQSGYPSYLYRIKHDLED